MEAVVHEDIRPGCIFIIGEPITFTSAPTNYAVIDLREPEAPSDE